MLKLKEEMKMEDLEKFGFIRNHYGQYVTRFVKICRSRKIMGRGKLNDGLSMTYAIEDLYDLIKLGMIDKE